MSQKKTRTLPAIASRHDRRQPLPIEDYALIGDLQTAALVGMDGSIDWLCLPTFSSEACFSAILGTPRNGRWLLRPKDAVKNVTRCYRPGTLILETRMETSSGTVLITDFMPVREGSPHMARLVKCLSGRVHMCSELVLRFDYGQAVPWVSSVKEGVRAVCGPDMVVLRSPTECHGEEMSTVSDFKLRAGEETYFSITYQHSHLPTPEPLDCKAAFEETCKFWEEWSAKSSYKGIYSHAVQRSLITVKALTYRPTGGIVAAPTTSLPEKLGGVRNWDYRYCWLRDTTFTLLALLNAGYIEEGASWRDWLVRALAGSANQVQIMYGICGERSIPERTMEHLEGYQGARPVRAGNGAVSQTQLDIYGEVLDAFYHGMSLRLEQGREIPEDRLSENLSLIANLLQHLDGIWENPDRGIWEMRTPPQHYVHSKVMAWVAYDRALRICSLVPRELSRKLPVKQWTATRDKIHKEVCRHGYSKRLGSFTQTYANREMDASLLLLPLVGFLPADDPRIAGTVHAVEKALLKNGLLMRYKTRGSDGLPPGEGAFLACSFWLVICRKLLGREKEATGLFDKLLALQNDVGLLAEEYDTDAGRQVGNFPQALSHITLLHAAFALGTDTSVLQRHVAQEHRTMGADGVAASPHSGVGDVLRVTPARRAQ